MIHTVTSGESIAPIAAGYGIAPQVIAALNGLTVQSPLAVGQALFIRFPSRTHSVVAGDTLNSIAASYGVSLNELYRNNPQLKGLPNLTVGQSLVIQYEGTAPYSYLAGGYAYPFIKQDILDTTAPFMDVLIPFTYGFRTDGSLYELDDKRILDAAGRYGTQTWMHLSTYTEGEQFDVGLAETVLGSTALQDTLINNIISKMNENGYSGLDVDFEFLGKENALPYADFLARITGRLNPLGYTVTAALAPKTSATQAGALYEGHDYASVAAAVNHVLLMTYEWGYTYSSPQAISPLPQVRRVLEYALTEMPKEKIYLGISNYGYRWTLPYNAESPVAAPSLSTAEAWKTAVRTGAVIEYDILAQAPHFTYSENGKQYEVWFEDVRSLQARLALVTEYGIAGALYWSLDRENVQNLSLLNSLLAM